MTSRNPAFFFPHIVVLCLLQIPELAVIITVNTINWLVFAVGMQYVFC
jgi:hypothetical protein